ncbi:MAG: outer membrane protein assembly factor BamA [Candidatus Omnitrophica bacterium]|nr:outer membrane protein assembly factor BamA [Candidatus Omnitrophota bacterium]
MRQRISFILCAVLFFIPWWAFAETDSSPQTIQAIEIQGNRIVSAETILAKMKTKTGSAFSQEVLDEDLKRLYATGFFTDIRIDREEMPQGVKVVVLVTEKPVLSAIHFAGNKALKEKKLQEIIKVKVKEFLDHSRLRQDVLALTQEYQKKGYSRAKVDYDVEVSAENEAAATFRIEEGKRIKIKEIQIEGNVAFTDKRIKRLIKTKKDTLFTSGFLKEDMLKEDVERITAFYKSEGYLDVVVDDHMEYDAEGEKIHLVFTVDEGRRYLVGQVEISGTLIFPEHEIRKTLTMEEGNSFSREGLRQDIANIQKYYFDKGYINAEINADTSLDEETSRVDVRYTLIENELTYIRQIKIRGNVRTKDTVVRRELRVLPGDPFNGEKLKRSRDRLFNLGFFDEVAFDTEPTATSNQSDLVVDVKEKKTGEFSFGAGFSSIDRFIGFVEIAQRNFDWQNPPSFVGDGQDLRLRAQLGATRQDYQVSWTEPWMFDRPISFGFDLYHATRERSGTSGFGYDEERLGGDVRLGKAFGEYNRGNLMYKIEQVEISDIPTTASSALKAEEGKNTVSSIEAKLTRDTRDNVFSPAKGYVATGLVELAGGPLGADRDFAKYFVSGTSYFTPLRPEQVLSLGGRAGLVQAYSDSPQVPIFERFFAGGTNTIRGYEERDVGPKDTASGDPIGGEALLVGNVEYLFPVVQILKGAIFYDVGGVWSEASDFGQGDYRHGAGVGVRVKTPIGPISLDYGFPLNPDNTQEDSGRFHFNISRSF